MGAKREPYRGKFKLLNKSEQLLFSKLQESAPALLVFSQVSMSQLFYITDFYTNNKGKEISPQINEIGRKSVDFLLCRKNTSILLAIELNGSAHKQEDQQIRDAKKQAALEEAGIPLVIFTPNEIPDVAELRKILAPHIVERYKNEAAISKRMEQANSRKKTAN